MKHLFTFIILFLLFSCSKKWADNIAEKGHSQEMINNYEEALKIYNKGIKRNKRSALLFWRRGKIYHRKGNYDLAIKDYSKSIEIDSLFNTGYAFWDRANSKENLKDIEGALEDYDKAISINPKKSNFLSYRGILKYRLEDYEGSLRDLDSAVKYGGNNYYLARSYRSTLRFILEDYKGALQDYNYLDFSKKDELNPEMAWEFRFRGISKFKTKDTIGACNDWKIAEKHNDSVSRLWLKKYCE